MSVFLLIFNGFLHFVKLRFYPNIQIVYTFYDLSE